MLFIVKKDGQWLGRRESEWLLRHVQELAWRFLSGMEAQEVAAWLDGEVEEIKG